MAQVARQHRGVQIAQAVPVAPVAQVAQTVPVARLVTVVQVAQQPQAVRIAPAAIHQPNLMMTTSLPQAPDNIK